MAPKLQSRLPPINKAASVWKAPPTAPIHDEEFEVVIDRGKAEELGLDVDLEEKGIRIFAVDKGPVENWNKAQPDKTVSAGDLIVKANDVRGDANKILAELMQSKVHFVKIQKGNGAEGFEDPELIEEDIERELWGEVERAFALSMAENAQTKPAQAALNQSENRWSRTASSVFKPPPEKVSKPPPECGASLSGSMTSQTIKKLSQICLETESDGAISASQEKSSLTTSAVHSECHPLGHDEPDCEVDSVQCPRPWELAACQEPEQKYPMSLAKTNKKVEGFTKLCDLSAGMLADTIRDYMEKEELVEARFGTCRICKCGSTVLQLLDLRRNPNMSCESLGRIVKLLMGYQIQAVNLSWNPHLGDSMIPAIQPLLEAKESHLTDLNLAKCGPGLTVAGLKWLVKVASKSTLRLLDISYIRISDESELIEQMLELPMIEELAFRFCDLSPEDARTIAEGLPLTGVKSLHLTGNSFGSQGLVHLASKLSESMVEELDLSGVGLEAKCEGLSQLAKAWVKRPFPKLHLRSNPMGHAEAMNFIITLQTLMPSNPVDTTFMGNVDTPRCC